MPLTTGTLLQAILAKSPDTFSMTVSRIRSKPAPPSPVLSVAHAATNPSLSPTSFLNPNPEHKPPNRKQNRHPKAFVAPGPVPQGSGQ